MSRVTPTSPPTYTIIPVAAVRPVQQNQPSERIISCIHQKRPIERLCQVQGAYKAPNRSGQEPFYWHLPRNATDAFHRSLGSRGLNPIAPLPRPAQPAEADVQRESSPPQADPSMDPTGESLW